MYYGTRPSRNLIPFPYYSSSTTINGVRFTVNDDGTVIVNGTATAKTSFALYKTNASNGLKLTGTYTFTLEGGYRETDNTGIRGTVSIYENGGSKWLRVEPTVRYTFSGNEVIYEFLITMDEGVTADNFLAKFMANECKTALPYERGSKNYPQRVKAIKRKLTTKTVTVRNPKNLIPFPYKGSFDNPGGLSTTMNDDGSIRIRGTQSRTYAYKMRLPDLELGKTYSYTLYSTDYMKRRLTGHVSVYKKNGTFRKNLGNSSNGNKFTFTVTEDVIADEQYSCVNVYIERSSTEPTVDIIVYPMFNEDATAEPYFVEQDIPYYVPVLCDIELPVDTQTNLITFPYNVSNVNAKNIVFTIQDDGGIHVKGTVGDVNEYVNIDNKKDIISGVMNSVTKPTLDGYCISASYDNVSSDQVRVLINKYGDVAVAVRANQGYVDGIVYPKLNRGNKPTPWYPRNEEVN